MIASILVVVLMIVLAGPFARWLGRIEMTAPSRAARRARRRMAKQLRRS